MILSSALSWLGNRSTSAVVPLSTDEPIFPAEALDGRLEPPIIALPPPPAPEHEELWDLRAISPRDFANVMHELYLSGLLTWAQYRIAGFPSELHPDYDFTIGALTGEKAEPDRPRDMIAEWEKRLEFEQRYSAGTADVRGTERILALLIRHRHHFVPLLDQE
jgi:hypothetical protein